MDALYTAATGMAAQQVSMDVIANNLANVNTAGFKATRLTFQDLLYQQLGDRQGASPTGKMQMGMGVAPAQTSTVLTQGELLQTGDPTSFAIEGGGYFRVQVGGETAYTRNGNFFVDGEGSLTTTDGYRVLPKITVPNGADRSIGVGVDGTVTVNVNGALTSLGTIKLATFINPSGLEAAGNSLYRATDNSGAEQVGNPGSAQQYGLIRQGFTEGSNVSVMEEMVNMISAQRAFETVSKVISGSDEMMGMANNIRR